MLIPILGACVTVLIHQGRMAALVTELGDVGRCTSDLGETRFPAATWRPPSVFCMPLQCKYPRWWVMHRCLWPLQAIWRLGSWSFSRLQMRVHPPHPLKLLGYVVGPSTVPGEVEYHEGGLDGPVVVCDGSSGILSQVWDRDLFGGEWPMPRLECGSPCRWWLPPRHC